MQFPCTKCGSCCAHVGELVKRLKIKWVPGLNPNGSCRALGPNNTCTIYETRPHLCRITAMKPKGLSMAKWFAINANSCNELQAMDGIPASYRVTTEMLQLQFKCEIPSHVRDCIEKGGGAIKCS